jgi:hypothetical protein
MYKSYIISLGKEFPTDSSLIIENDAGKRFEAKIESVEWNCMSVLCLDEKGYFNFPKIFKLGEINFCFAELIFNALSDQSLLEGG